MKKFSYQTNKKLKFNSILLELLTNIITEELWQQEISRILDLIGVGCENQSIQDFIVYDNFQPFVEQMAINNDVIIYVNGRDIKVEVTTIHSVKGETHAATLVLENKSHNYDAELISDYILGDNTTIPTAARKIKFMKQFYVGFTRPKHLLCLVMDKSRLPEEHIDKAKVAGWKIKGITTLRV